MNYALHKSNDGYCTSVIALTLRANTVILFSRFMGKNSRFFTR